MNATLPYVEAPAGEQPIALVELRVDTAISGVFAETTQTMVFHNPNSRPLEGSLVFPLPDGAAVSGYALDVNGQLVDGVIVPKQEARRILETEIRKGVDPGLVEQVAGNLHRIRIYPLPAGGTRTIALTYISELTIDGNAAAYHVPLAIDADFRLEVQSPVPPECPGLTMREENGVWAGEARIPGGRDILVRLPNLPDAFALVQATDQGETFFCLSVKEDAPPPAWRPTKVGVVWDASGSRPDTDVERDLLRELSRAWGATAVELTVVRNRHEEPRFFEDLAAAADFLQTVPSDGATSLAGLNLDDRVDVWLVFTDGLDTMAPEPPRVGGAPVYTLTSQSASQAAWLSRAGTALHLGRTALPRALEILTSTPTPAVAVQGGTRLHVQRAHGRTHILGQLTPSQPSASARGLRVDREGAHQGTLLPRAWAAQESQALQMQDDQKGLVELGRRYHLVTPGTSLLVLESLEQYLEYDLEPPASQPHLKEAFQVRRRQQSETEESARKARLDRVAGLWAARVEWWTKDFEPSWPKPGPPTPPPDPFGRGGTAVGGGGDRDERVACMMAAPQYEESLDMAPSFDLEIPAEPMMACEAEPMPAPPAAPAPAPSMRLAMRAAPSMAPTGELGEQARKKEAAPAKPKPSISIQGWNPETPYLKAMQASEEPYSVYLRERAQNSNSPSFFLDCGDHLLKRGQRLEGLTVLSNLLELALEDAPLLRTYAWRLRHAGELDEAVDVLRRVRRIRPDEPQSQRDLALALADRYERDGKEADAREAVQLLYSMASQVWDRFPEVELIALMELNRLLAVASRHGLDLTEGLDQRLLKTLDLDVRISLAWDADLTDVDLHVYEPTGEQAYYANNRTQIGGLVSRDIRDGYGPEEYVLRKAFPGVYRIAAHYYASHQQTLTGPCTVLATVYTDYARPEEQRQFLTLRLDTPNSQVNIGEVTLG